MGPGQGRRRRQGAQRTEAHRRRCPRSRPRHRASTPGPGGQAGRRRPRRLDRVDADGKPVPRSVPHDSSHHGTNVAGTIAGGDASGTQIGVAPDADLIRGLVISNGNGSLAKVIADTQWATDERPWARHDPQGYAAKRKLPVSAKPWILKAVNDSPRAAISPA
ncbi:S8 family serine peptidase [Streptomyces sp. NPDC005148]